MKKKSILMLGVAAMASSAMFASSAFAKMDEDGAYVAPPAVFYMQTNQTENLQPTTQPNATVDAPVVKDDKKF